MNEFKNSENYKNIITELSGKEEKNKLTTAAGDALRSIDASAENGNPDAQFLLGLSYRFGSLDRPQDFARAITWLERAADQGHVKAMTELATIYYGGDNGKPEYDKAVYWARKAADQNDDMAQLILAWYYESGESVEKDLNQAAAWFRKAADQGNAAAQFGLGVLYANGTGVRRDMAIAMEWFRKSAEQGFAPAMKNYGRCFELGNVNSKSLAAAIHWYEKAVEAGEEDAEELLVNARKAYQEQKEAEERRTREAAEYRERQRKLALKEARDTSLEMTSIISVVLFVLAVLVERWAAAQDGKLSLLILAYAAQVIFAAGAAGFGLGSFTSGLGLPGAVAGAAGGLAQAVLGNIKPENVLRLKLYSFAVAAVIVAVMIFRISIKKKRPKP